MQHFRRVFAIARRTRPALSVTETSSRFGRDTDEIPREGMPVKSISCAAIRTPYKGTDFNGIFAGLDDGSYDCIASGTTITPERSKVADFCPPYAASGQSLVADAPI
jgi:ABC-type amino acid transport substrate-binding protein